MQLCFSFLLSLCFLVPYASPEVLPAADRAEAQQAFVLLNKIRMHAELYATELKLYATLPVTQTELVWNDTLAKVAEEKAKDMACRNYFAHVDPDGYGMNYFIHKAGYRLTGDFRKNKDANNFESLDAGIGNGEAAIKDLILDEGVPSMGHRNHLLGIGTWNNSLKDIGIGFVRCKEGCKYHTYMCVLIAKHSW